MSETTYEANVSRLEQAWERFITVQAKGAVTATKSDHGPGDVEGWQLAAAEIVSARLLNQGDWADVTAVTISDIAYEAVCREIDSRRR